jgi:hypothetical protein
MAYGYSIDTKAISQYQRNVLEASKKLKDFERRFLETLAGMVMEKVIPRTPVDTGRLRRSWKISKVTEKGDTLEITIFNDARDNGMDESYASYVEYGHFTRGRVSWVEGVWMLTVSTDEVKNEMSRVWNRLFNEFVKEAGL